MATETDKAKAEVAMFREFVKRASLPIDPESVVKRNPPEPDILCLHWEEGLIAFELTEICDHTIARVISTESEIFFWTSDPTREIVVEKRSKNYKTPYPIELLLYTCGRVVTPDNVIIPEITRHVRKFEGQFRRVWFLGRKEAHLICGFS